MKQLLLTIVIASAAAIFAPRDLQEASTLVTRAGLALINLGVTLYPHEYDAGGLPDDPVQNQDAGHRAGARLYPAQFRREWGVPFRPGCERLGCQRMWDDDRQRPFRRCRWRCPRERPAPEPEYVPTPRYPPPHLQEAAGDVPPELLLIGLIGVAVIALVVVFSGSQDPDPLREADEAMAEAAEAAEAQAKLDAAARAADAVIKRQAARAFARGRHSS
jgi:hypothetical protein